MLDSTIGSIKVCMVMNTCEGSVLALDSCSLLETTVTILSISTLRGSGRREYRRSVSLSANVQGQRRVILLDVRQMDLRDMQRHAKRGTDTDL